MTFLPSCRTVTKDGSTCQEANSCFREVGCTNLQGTNLGEQPSASQGDAHFKGEENYDSYQESGMVKYTIGASANYNEIYQLRKSLLDKFPEAFIIAFKNGKKYDVNQAIREFKQNKNR